MRTIRLVAPIALAILVVACGGEDEPAGEFSPFIQPGSAGSYDLLIQGVDSIRSADLAPGAAPAVPLIEDDKAMKMGHFITTYTAEADPVEIGEAMLEAIQSAAFVNFTKWVADDSAGSWSVTVTYRTDGAEGTITLRLSPTDTPTRLDIVYEVVEQLN